MAEEVVNEKVNEKGSKKEERGVNAPLIRKDLVMKAKALATIKGKHLNEIFAEALAEYVEEHREELKRLIEILSS